MVQFDDDTHSNNCSKYIPKSHNPKLNGQTSECDQFAYVCIVVD